MYESDEKLMEETAALFERYGSNWKEFKAFILKEFQNESLDDNWGSLPSWYINLGKYFRAERAVPTQGLYYIAKYLPYFKLPCTATKKDEENYTREADILKEKIEAYLAIKYGKPRNFRGVIRESLQRRTLVEIEWLFDKFLIFQLPERVWNYWMCYNLLDPRIKEKIREDLGEFAVSTMQCAKFLQQDHWMVEITEATKAAAKKEILNYRGKICDEKADSKNKELNKSNYEKMIERLVDLLYEYPYPCTKDRKCLFYAERSGYHITQQDQSVMFMYSLLCQVLEDEDIREVDETMYRCVNNEKYLFYPQDHLTEDEKHRNSAERERKKADAIVDTIDFASECGVDFYHSSSLCGSGLINQN